MISGILQNRYLILLSRIVLGAIFIYASIDKINHPLAFAQVIHYYRLAPPALINYIAIAMPWIEMIAGIFLIIGFKVNGADLLIGAMLIFFIVVLAVTAIRGINVSCGCFSTSTAVKSDLVMRVIEDIGMLIPGLHIFCFYKNKAAKAA